jgi:serine/threonine-protein phosphatase 2A activator
MAENRPRGTLDVLDAKKPHTFQIPSKRINEGEDVDFWLTSWAYTDLMTFLLQLNASMFPLKRDGSSFQAWTLDAAIQLSDTVQKIRSLIQELEDLIKETPPDPGPRRFGNVSFRTWYQLVEDRLDYLLDVSLPKHVLEFGGGEDGEGATARAELKAYLLGSFGSAQRLDYGTGHELSFIAFLSGIWKLGGFDNDKSKAEAFGARERELVLGLIEPYVLVHVVIYLFHRLTYRTDIYS